MSVQSNQLMGIKKTSRWEQNQNRQYSRRSKHTCPPAKSPAVSALTPKIRHVQLCLFLMQAWACSPSNISRKCGHAALASCCASLAMLPPLQQFAQTRTVALSRFRAKFGHEALAAFPTNSHRCPVGARPSKNPIWSHRCPDGTLQKIAQIGRVALATFRLKGQD